MLIQIEVMRQNHDEIPTHEIIIMGNKMFYFKCGSIRWYDSAQFQRY